MKRRSALHYLRRGKYARALATAVGPTLARRPVRRIARLGGERFSDDQRALALLRITVNQSVAARIQGDIPTMRRDTRSSLRLAAPRLATALGASIAESLVEVTEDPGRFHDITVTLADDIERADPGLATGLEWLRLRFVLASHGFVHTSTLARVHARTAAWTAGNRPGATRDELILATALAADAAESGHARKLLARIEGDGRHPPVPEPLVAFIALGEGARNVADRGESHLRSQDQQFADLVAGRTVAVVGPSPSPKPHGDEIDSHDIVVRLNFAGPGTSGDPSGAGTRTDVSYYRSPRRLRHNLPVDGDAVLLPSGLRFAVTEDDMQAGNNPPADRSGTKGHPTRYVGPPIRTSFTPRLHGLFGAKPNGYQKLQMVLFDLLHFAPARIRVFNATLYASPELYHDGFESARATHQSPVEICKQFAMQDPIGNHNFVRNLLDVGSIEVDEQAHQVLASDPPTYAHELDRLFGAPRWTVVPRDVAVRER